MAKGRIGKQITFNGITLNITQWADQVGMSARTLQRRIRINGPQILAICQNPLEYVVDKTIPKVTIGGFLSRPLKQRREIIRFAKERSPIIYYLKLQRGHPVEIHDVQPLELYGWWGRITDSQLDSLSDRG